MTPAQKCLKFEVQTSNVFSVFRDYGMGRSKKIMKSFLKSLLFNNCTKNGEKQHKQDYFKSIMSFNKKIYKILIDCKK